MPERGGANGVDWQAVQVIYPRPLQEGRGRLGRIFNSGDDLVDVLMGFEVWRWMVVSSAKVVTDADLWL
jgi:hypothetical protein